MGKSYMNREYVTMRVIFIVAIVLITNLAWSLISFSNGFTFEDILSQKGFLQKFLLGVLETATLIELPFFIVWKALTLRDRHTIRLYAVAVMVSLIQENPRNAEEFLLEMTDMHRSIIRFSSLKSIPVMEEFRLLSSYMNMSRYRFGDGCINLVIDPGTEDVKESHIIPLSLLHLVENAIKHNSYSVEAPLTISIDVETDERGESFLSVTNNRQEKISKPASTKQGLENIRRKYLLVSGQTPVIEDTMDYFKVRLPIIEQWKY